MKIKEIKAKSSKSQLNELQLSSLLGDYGAAQMKQAFGAGAGRTKQDIMTQNIFIKNFVSNALTSLKSAIQGGVVDPKKTTPRKATDKDLDQTYKTMQPGDLGDFDLKDKLAKEKEAQALAAKDKEAADIAAARTARAASVPTNPEVKSAVDTRMQRADQATKAQTTTPTSVADKLDQAAAQRTTAPSALGSQSLPASEKSKVRKTQLFNPLKVVSESTYDRLNQIFEKILNEAVAVPDEDTTKYSIEQYLKDVWFPNYMKGVDTTANAQKIDQIVKQVADTYPKDGGRAALTQLANLSYAISPRKTKPEPKKKAAEPAAQEKPAAVPAEKSQEQPTVKIGQVLYTKGPRGWMDVQKKTLVSANIAQTLDQLSQKQQQTAEPETDADTTQSNVTNLKRTGTAESKKRKIKK